MLKIQIRGRRQHRTEDSVARELREEREHLCWQNSRVLVGEDVVAESLWSTVLMVIRRRTRRRIMKM